VFDHKIVNCIEKGTYVVFCPVIFKQSDHTHFGVSELSHFELELSSIKG
jgi:hypothetical protein